MADDRGTTGLTIGAAASASAAVLHATAAGIHAEHAGLARVFIVLAVAQLGAAVLGFVRGGRLSCGSMLAVNGAALAGWAVTRVTGIGWIGGLEVAERPQPADTIAAVLAAVAAAAAGACALGWSARPSGRVLGASAVVVGVLLVPALADATTHDHAGHDTAADGEHDDGHDHDTGDAAGAAGEAAAAGTDDHATDGGHDHDTGGASDAAFAGTGEDDVVAAPDGEHHDGHGDHVATGDWPRPWDPAAGIDFSGVDGVTPEQQARAEALVADTLRDLPSFADVATAESLGYRSIGDAATGFEHFLNRELFDDGKILDPTAPESLVYRVDGDARTLVSAMFIVARTPIDDPSLADFAGPLMQWHVHDNLCWGLDDNGEPVVRSVLEAPGDTCPEGTVNAGGDNPMVHVWITPHECGPFAALEGHGAGQAGVGEGSRTDLCTHDHDAIDDHGDDHDHGDGHDGAVAAPVPYDPELPIDLGGVPGVTPQQQAFAENLVAATIRDLPQWADVAAAEAAGFRSIGDGATGHEHYIQWDWIDDDVWLDPDYPESLVFEPRPDGTKRLVSAMFMLPSGYPLDEVPDWGGPLMQWHVHGDLCFTDDPEAPKVAGLKPIGTSCDPPLIDGTMAPMIHVWITPHACGPFAALEGVAGGQVRDGEEILCDEAHGAH